MATKLTDTLTGISTTGTKNPSTLTKWPEFGATAQVALSGVGVSATVRLTAWVIGGKPETLATFVLNAAKTYDSVPIFSTWDDWAWEVDAVSDATGLTLALVGVGV
jgi:hypothetical protein